MAVRQPGASQSFRKIPTLCLSKCQPSYNFQILDWSSDGKKLLLGYEKSEPYTSELGTKEDYFKVTEKDNLAAFIRSIVGIEQSAINIKFNEFLNSNILTSKQQEFIKSVINYVRQNGDITFEDIIEKSPFNDEDVSRLFELNIKVLQIVINELHRIISI